MIDMVGNKKSHLLSYISAKDRAKQYIPHENGGKLFCTPCNKVLDHRGKSTIDYHLQGIKHQHAEHFKKKGRSKRQ